MADILVVDDDAAVREAIALILEADEHTVRTAGDGAAALHAVLEQMPHLILLDLAMPGVDGWRFLEELHARDLRRHTRVIIVSGRTDPYSVAPARTVTGGRFLPKPFEPEVLARMVADALAQAPDELYAQTDRSRNLAWLIEKLDTTLAKSDTP